MSALLTALERLAAGTDLTEEEAHGAVSAIMEGATSEVAIAAFLTALRVKGETADELAGAVRAARERMLAWEPLDPPCRVLDTCGTGGDGARSINISTATALVVAACGVPVAKHGNRSASGNSGSAEVLTELGVVIESPPSVQRRTLAELGIAFLFAPAYHPALRFAGPVRRQLPFRTLFNLVGPLANPARPEYQLVGAPGVRQAELLARTLIRLGIHRAAVVNGADGLDEVTLDGVTRVWWVEDGAISTDEWTATDFGLPVTPASELRVSGPAESALRLRGLFAGEPGPVRHVVLANAAAALLVAQKANGPREGVALAARALDSGAVSTLLERWAALSQRT
jgi:anthranilate phosphoribosyltransferase